MRKRIVSIMCAVACIGAMGLAACTPGGGGGTNPGGEDAVINNNWWTTTGTLDKDADGNVIFDDVEIKLSTVVNGTDKGAFNQIVGEFNALYRGKINVVVTNISDSGFEDTVAKQITNKSNPPDLIMSHQKGHKSFADNKMIQPFNEVMEASGITFDMNDYASGLAKYSNLGYKDTLFSIPADAQSVVVLYNKTILTKYAEKLPETHSELLTLCDTVAAGENITPIAWSTSETVFNNYVFETAVAQNGGSLYNTETYYAEWDSEQNLPAYKNALKAIRDFTGRQPKALAQIGAASSATLNAYLSNKALFYFSAPWNVKDVIEGYARQNNMSVAEAKENVIGATSLANWFAIEENTENSGKISGDSHFFAISKTVSDINKKAAICEFVKWFTQTGSVGAEWAEAGHITASKIISADEDYTSNSFVSNYIANFYPDINKFECLGNTPYYSALRSNLTSIVVSGLATTDSAGDEAIIRNAKKKLNDEIDFIRM